MRLALSAGVALTLAASPLSPPLAADGPAAGFQAATAAFTPPLSSVSAELSGGDLIVFDGLAVERVQPDGTFVESYLTLPGFAFPSFVVLAPDESFAVVGENSTGELYRIDVGSGAASPLANVPANYDADVDAAGNVWVSAFDGSLGMNALERVAPSGTVTRRAVVPGFSGPLALEPSGDLLLCVADGPNRVLRYSAAQLAGTALLLETDGALVSESWSGISYLDHDPETGDLYVVENDFVLFDDPVRVYRAGADKATSSIVYEAAANEFAGKVVLRTSTADPEIFLAFQPAAGGVLTLPVTDFATFAEHRTVRPRRPTTSVSGPGAGVGTIGNVTLTVEGAEPNGLVFLFYGAAATFDPAEAPVFLGGGVPPLFWGLDVPTQRGIPFALALDGTGSTSLTFYDPGFLGGFVAMQVALSDLNLNLVGTATGSVL